MMSIVVVRLQSEFGAKNTAWCSGSGTGSLLFITRAVGISQLSSEIIHEREGKSR